jgi:hypothetical protein
VNCGGRPIRQLTSGPTSRSTRPISTTGQTS